MIRTGICSSANNPRVFADLPNLPIRKPDAVSLHDFMYLEYLGSVVLFDAVGKSELLSADSNMMSHLEFGTAHFTALCLARILFHIGCITESVTFLEPCQSPCETCRCKS